MVNESDNWVTERRAGVLPPVPRRGNAGLALRMHDACWKGLRMLDAPRVVGLRFAFVAVCVVRVFTGQRRTVAEDCDEQQVPARAGTQKGNSC